MITNEEASVRLAQFREPLWTFEQVSDWYAVDLDKDPDSLWVLYKTWAESQDRYGRPIGDQEQRTINRNLFELFLQNRHLMPARMAAARLGMNVQDFKSTLAAGVAARMLSGSEAHGDFLGDVYRAELVRDFHKFFPKLAAKTFSTYTSFVTQLHEQILSTLNVPVTTIWSTQSEALTDEPPEPVHDFDIITNDPLGLQYQVVVDTVKPLQLRPDCCSLLTLFEFYDLLREFCHGREEELEEHRDAFQGYLARRVSN